MNKKYTNTQVGWPLKHYLLKRGYLRFKKNLILETNEFRLIKKKKSFIIKAGKYENI